jgi:hypothetical protein
MGYSQVCFVSSWHNSFTWSWAPSNHHKLDCGEIQRRNAKLTSQPLRHTSTSTSSGSRQAARRWFQHQTGLDAARGTDINVNQDSFTLTSSEHNNLGHNEFASIQEELGYIPPNVMSISARCLHNSTRPVAIRCYPLGGGSPRRQRKSEINEQILTLTNTDQPQRGTTPFPTLYWLCNRDISQALSNLERQGYVKVLDEKLAALVSEQEENNADNLFDLVEESHILYAKQRWDALSPEDRHHLLAGQYQSDSSSTKGILSVLRDSGVAGTDFRKENNRPSVKCLHAHYAFYRSNVDVCTVADHRLDNNSAASSVPGNPRDDVELSTFVLGQWIHELLLDTIPGKL